ncbi:MAG: glycosyltransferase, partial [Magnetococcales bacterium]|nr:glycosyltransferase [Magnetococcales bacterium]
ACAARGGWPPWWGGWGGGPEEEALRRLVERHPLKERILLAGRLPQPQALGCYPLLSLAVFPRRRERVTEMVTPLKPLEAMAAGIPVLASAVGGHRELLPDPETARLFAPDDPQALADQAAALLADEAWRRRMAQEARRWVETRRSWEQLVPLCRSAYEAALGRPVP